ncbi:MAG TPA: hypothetical protein PKW49_09465 [Paludibacteraceae bacterium]|nr:hypothetical protein [Paludibacteraceae bacterium]HQF50864.1 hypothetical protein [Paludibacteraceae bacterium]
MNTLKTLAIASISLLSLSHTYSAENEKSDSTAISDTIITNIEYESLPETEDQDYATLYVYRPFGPGMLVSYKLNLDDSVLCRVKNDWCQKVTIKKEGMFTLWAQSEGKEKLPIYIEKGGVYFIRCSVVPGFFVGHPLLELVDEEIGTEEYFSIVKENYESLVILKTGLTIKCHILDESEDAVTVLFLKNGNEETADIKKENIKEIETLY